MTEIRKKERRRVAILHRALQDARFVMARAASAAGIDWLRHQRALADAIDIIEEVLTTAEVDLGRDVVELLSDEELLRDLLHYKEQAWDEGEQVEGADLVEWFGPMRDRIKRQLEGREK